MQLSWALFYQSASLFLIEHHHWTIQQTSVLLATIGGIMACGLLGIYYLIVRIISHQALAFSCFCLSLLSIILFLTSHHVTMLYVSAGLLALFVGLYYPALVTLMTREIDRLNDQGVQPDVIHNDNRIDRQRAANKHAVYKAHGYGWLMGCNTLLLRLAWFIASASLGFLMNVNSYLPMLIQMACIIIVVFLMVTSVRDFN